MFHHDGRWKEFGINGVDTTYFPFWLFCIVWAVTAYGIIRTLYSESSPTISDTVTPVASTNVVKNEPLAPLPVPTTPIPKPAENSHGKPGYYKLDEAVMKEKGTPLYVYIGPEKPADLE